MNIMLKWARRIVVFVLLGALINCAVAWACAAIGARVVGSTTHFGNPRPDETPVVAIARAPGYKRADQMARWWDFYGDERIARAAWPRYGSRAWWPAGGLEDAFIGQAASGWPCLSVRATIYPDWLEPLVPVENLVSGKPPANQPMPTTDWTADARRRTLFSLRPIPIGFVVNTTFYAALVFCFVAAGSAARRYSRRKTGRCTACGYPRGTSPLCTECGEPLPTHAAK